MSNILDDIFDSEYRPYYSDTRSLNDKLNEIDREKRQRAFDERLMELFFNDSNETPGPELLRSLVEGTAWFIPVDDSGSPRIREVAPGAYREAIDPQGDKNRKTGKGGRLLAVYAQSPTEKYAKARNKIKDSSNKENAADEDEKRSDEFKQISGIELVRIVHDTAGSIDGLLLRIKDDFALELGSKHFDELKSLLISMHLESMLAFPAPGQIEPLKQATFLVNMKDGKPLRDSGLNSRSRLVVAFTHRDRLSTFGDNRGIEPITGDDLFRKVAEENDCEGLLINGTCIVGTHLHHVYRPVLSPAFAYNMAKGIDIRPGVAPLPARSYQEILVWLHLARFPNAKPQFVIDAQTSSEILVRAIAPEAKNWTMHETDSKKESKEGQISSPVFSLPPNTPPLAEDAIWPLCPDASNEYGPGPTRILCPGLMASHFNMMFYADPKNYKAGKWLLFGRYLNDFGLRETRHKLAIVKELWKLLPPGEDQIPRTSILTVEGAAHLQERPQAGTRKWLEEMIPQLERYSKHWVWGW